MARGRFIEKKICFDKTVNELSCFESMLGYTWLITHLDCEGRTYGDPAVVRSLVFPRRTDITVEQMESFIQEWHDTGLIIWYEVDGEKYIYSPKFKLYQVGLNPDREAKSVIPTHEQVRSESGAGQEQIPVKVKVSVNDNPNDKCEVEGELHSDEPFYLFSKVFQKETGLPDMSGGVPRYIKSINEMIDMGAEPDDLKVAIAELRKKEYQIVSPGSCVNAVRNVIGKRKTPAKSLAEIIQEA